MPVVLVCVLPPVCGVERAASLAPGVDASCFHRAFKLRWDPWTLELLAFESEDGRRAALLCVMYSAAERQKLS